MKKQFTELIGACFALVLLLTTTSGIQAQYCEVSAGDLDDDWMSNVTFAGIDNDSGQSLYSDFTDIVGIVEVGETYSFSTDLNYNGAWNQFVTVFIDLNQDEVFNNEDERFDIGNCVGPDPCTVSGDITIPSAVPGTTRMRVIENYNGYAADACNVSTFSEIEDYTLLVDGDCTPVTFISTITDDCEAQTYSVSAELVDFAGNPAITVIMTRSDEVIVPNANYPAFLEGETVDVITDVPFGVTVSATIAGLNPDCNLSRTWNEEGLCPPPNNECETAIAVDCNSVTAGSTTNGSSAPEIPYCGEANLPENSPGVWYSFTSDGFNFVTIGTQNSFVNDELFVYSGSCDGELVCELGINFVQQGNFYANDGETYLIYVTGFNGANGDFEMFLDCEPVPCDFPEVVAEAVDMDGNPIGDECLAADDEYRISVALTGGAGNSTYTVTAGDSTKTMADGETHIFGLYAAGSTVTVVATGDESALCFDDDVVSTTICPPDNDDCANAQPIDCGETVVGTNVGAAFDVTCNAGQERPGVWYMFTPSINAVASLETCQDPTNFDTDFSVFTGPDCDNLTCYSGFSDNGHVDGVSSCPVEGWAAGGPDAVFNVNAGETYYILVHGFGTTNTGTFGFSIECEEIICIPPTLTAVAVDIDSNPIEECQEFDAEFYVDVELTGGEGNESYTVSANGTSETLSSPGTFQFGPYTAGTLVNVSAVGDDDANCEDFASATTTVCAPLNDTCEDAFEAVCFGSYAGSTFGATAVEGQEYCGTSSPSADNGGVWYSLTLTGTTDVDIDLSGSEYDTKLFLYSGTCGELTCVDGDDDGGEGVDSRIQAQLDAGTYYIYVTGFSGNRGVYAMNISCVEVGCSPEVTATAVDVDENPIEECVDITGEYYVLVQLTGGLNNDFYDVSVNGGEPVQIAAEGSGVVGPVSAAVAANVTASGVTNPACAGSDATSVEVCPPSNDFPCDAIALPTDGTVGTYTNVDATTDEGEVITPDGSCATGWCDGTLENTVWFSFVGPESGRVDITLCGENSAGFDSQVAVWSATDCGDYSTFEIIGANDDETCEFGFGISSMGACVEPGETYLIQIDGWGGDVNPFDISVTEVDGAICACELPDLGPDVFTFADTEAICDDPENPMFSLTFYPPFSVGSGEGLVYTYDWPENEGEPITVVASTEPITAPETWPLNTIISISVTVSDTECEAADGSIYPLNGTVTQGFAACDPDCEGTPGGDVGPGSACDADGAPGVYNDDCECIPTPANDLCGDAIPVECGDVVEGTTVASSTIDVPGFCGTTPGTGGGVWYSIIGTGGEITASLCEGSDYDTKINVYEGPCGELVCVTGVDDACGLQSEVTWDSQSGVEYLIYVNGFGANTGAFTLTMSCEIISGASIEGTVAWNSDCGDRDITVNFYNPGTDEMVESYSGSVNVDGEFSIPAVSEGTYDVISKVDGYLAVGTTSFIFDAGPNLLNLGTIITGDINGDNGVNISDFSLFNGAFNSTTGDPNFNPLADLNCDGGVNISDFSAFNASFNLAGAEAPLEE